MMPSWFPGYGLLKYLFQIFLAASVSKWRLDVHLIISKKAWAKPAVCGEPEAIARRAEVVAHGTNETDLPSG
jgi:hypothetical protein